MDVGIKVIEGARVYMLEGVFDGVLVGDVVIVGIIEAVSVGVGGNTVKVGVLTASVNVGVDVFGTDAASR